MNSAGTYRCSTSEHSHQFSVLFAVTTRINPCYMYSILPVFMCSHVRLASCLGTQQPTNWHNLNKPAATSRHIGTTTQYDGFSVFIKSDQLVREDVRPSNLFYPGPQNWSSLCYGKMIHLVGWTGEYRSKYRSLPAAHHDLLKIVYSITYIRTPDSACGPYSLTASKVANQGIDLRKGRPVTATLKIFLDKH